MPNADAIVLRTIDFSETSLIVTLYTREFGKIEGLAKGGRRLKSPFESALDILARIRVTFLQKRGDALDLLTESKLVRRFKVERHNLAGLYGAYYVVELVDALTEPGDPNPAIYDITAKLLTRLEEGTFVMRSLIRFEGLFLRQIGHQPSFRSCVECGKAIDPDAAEKHHRRIAFGLLEGGVICSRCMTELRQTGQGGLKIYLSPAALKGYEQLTDPKDRSENWKRIPLDSNLLGEIRGLNNQYISHLLGRKPRLFDYLKFISERDRSLEAGVGSQE